MKSDDQTKRIDEIRLAHLKEGRDPWQTIADLEAKLEKGGK